MSKQARTIIGIIVIALIVILILPNSKKAGLLKIGVIAPLSGVVADYGEEIRKGILDIGTSTKVSFVFEDEKCDPKETVAAFKKLTKFEKVNFILGPACGSPQEAIIPLIKEQGAIVLVPSAASRSLYEQSGKNFFNVQYSLEDESKFIGERLNELGYKKVALVHYKNAFSETHAKSFKSAYKGEITDIVLTDETSDVAPELVKIKSAKVDAVYSPDISFFFANGLLKLRQYGVSVPVYSTYVTELPAVKSFVPGVYYSYPSDLTGSKGAVFELSKQAGQILSQYVEECSNSVSCVKEKLINSGKFDEFGVFKRPLILKQIK